MARKNKNLASFEELANNNIIKNNLFNNDEDIIANKLNINNANINNDSNDNENVDNNNKISKEDSVNINNRVTVEKQGDYLDSLIEGSVKKKENETVLTGIYLQKDLSQILDHLAKKGGRGAKSRIVNEALRTVFNDKGLF